MQSARKLLRRAYRDRTGEFLVEGPKVVLEALRTGAEFRDLFVAEDAPEIDRVLAAATKKGVAVQPVTGAVIEAMSDTSTPQGVIGIVVHAVASIAEIAAAPGIALVLAEVRDPGNAGTLVRSAVAAGAAGIAFTTGSVDPLNPKTVRASAGTLFHTRIARGVDLAAAVAALRDAGRAIIGADAASTVSLEELEPDRPMALVLGNEAWGLPDAARDLVDARVGIPMPGPAESLNVGIAGSILLFEALRCSPESILGR